MGMSTLCVHVQAYDLTPLKVARKVAGFGPLDFHFTFTGKEK